MSLLKVQIDRELAKIRQFYAINYPLCLFCGHLVRNGDLAHLIRRSESIALQTVKLNCGISHRDCHEIFDNDPDQAVYLPRFIECMYLIWYLDQQYFYRISGRYTEMQDVFARFPDLDLGELEHHGQLIQLYYLYA